MPIGWRTGMYRPYQAVVDQRSLSRKYLSIMVRSWGKSWKSPEIWKCYINNYERETAAGRVHFDAGRNQGSWQRKIAAGSVMQRGIAAGRDQVAAGRNQSRWQLEIVATAMKTDGSEGSLLVAFVPQRIAAGRDQGGWQQESAASSIVQREMRAAVEGIREVGGPKTAVFGACFVTVLDAVLWSFGCKLVGF
ncbi:hypothetical protein BHM03_00009788 [Ensete ventricosum]|uniref:Uncharacterized protein n=1 Tax=Ensete ventricosum TaxID=4639 RepID=A0A445MCU0_ENSVE|nr:hypothetical protein BHM03_00009788 [Ensete ventricosum]